MKRLTFALISFLLTLIMVFGACAGVDNENEAAKCGDFTLTSPTNGQEDVETMAQFEWTASVNALKYTFTISRNPDFTGGETEVYTKQNIASPYFTLTQFELEFDTTYYWKVEAIGRGEENRKLASNAPFSFTTRSDDKIEMNVSHLSYITGDDVEVSFTAPDDAQNLTLCVSKDQFFSDQSQQVLSVQVSGGSHTFSKSGLSGKYYARISAEIKGSTVYSNETQFYIGNTYKLHDFSAPAGGDSGYNNGIRLFNGTQMNYSIVDGALKIQYTEGSYLDYTIIDFSEGLKSVVGNAAYFYIRYKSEAYLGYFLCKMRGDNSMDNNWKDYYINNIPGDNEWKEVLMEIKVDTVLNLNRLSFGVSTQITRDFIMEPEREFETQGFYNGCVFPTANVVKDGTLYVYYGAGDRVIGVSTCDFEEMLKYLITECKKS
jgi:hypothetical protein